MAIAILRPPYSRESDGMVKALVGAVSLFDRIIAVLIAPLIGCLFGVLAWPVLLIWKIQDIQSTKERLAFEKDFPQPKNVRPGSPLIHARINGKVVTAKEWDAAGTQASGLPNSVAKDIAAGVIEKAKGKMC